MQPYEGTKEEKHFTALRGHGHGGNTYHSPWPQLDFLMHNVFRPLTCWDSNRIILYFVISLSGNPFPW